MLNSAIGKCNTFFKFKITGYDAHKINQGYIDFSGQDLKNMFHPTVEINEIGTQFLANPECALHAMGPQETRPPSQER